MRVPRSQHSMCAYENRYIFVTGSSKGIEACFSTEMYDIQLAKWTTLANMQVGRSGHASCCFKNRLYAVGGDCLSKVYGQMEQAIEYLDLKIAKDEATWQYIAIKIDKYIKSLFKPHCLIPIKNERLVIFQKNGIYGELLPDGRLGPRQYIADINPYYNENCDFEDYNEVYPTGANCAVFIDKEYTRCRHYRSFSYSTRSGQCTKCHQCDNTVPVSKLKLKNFVSQETIELETKARQDSNKKKRKAEM